MKQSLLILLCVILPLAAAGGGCSLDPDARLDRSLEHYVAGEPESHKDLEKELLRYASVDSVRGENLQTSGTLLYRLHENRAEVLYPVHLTLDLPDGSSASQVAASDNHAAVTDGIRLAVFDGSGSLRHDITIGDTKSPVRSILIDGNSVLYYRNARVYRHDIDSRSIDQAFRETFTSPYTSYYAARLQKLGNHLAVLAGIAGSYTFSIVQADNGTPVVKNILMASSRYYLGTKSVYYITGTSGRWELTEFDLASKTKKSLARFSDLIDIQPARSGYVCETSTGLSAALYRSAIHNIPFAYELAGACGGRILFRYKGSVYFIDMMRLIRGLEKIREKAPGLIPPR